MWEKSAQHGEFRWKNEIHPVLYHSHITAGYLYSLWQLKKLHNGNNRSLSLYVGFFQEAEVVNSVHSVIHLLDDWTLDDVVTWAKNEGVDDEDANKLRNLKINGKRLLKLTKQDFQMCVSVGAYVDLAEAVDKLCALMQLQGTVVFTLVV